jgi:hypothetical protein
MGRPQIINPNGGVKHFSARIPVPIWNKLQQEAKKRGVSISKIVRERLEL